jgi:hypothetical protein
VWNRRPSKLKTVDDKKRALGCSRFGSVVWVSTCSFIRVLTRSLQVLCLLAVAGETSVADRGWSIMNPKYPQPQCYEYVVI